MKLFLLLCIVATLSSCDGYTRSFTPPVGQAATPADEQMRLLTALIQVATERGYKRSEAHPESEAYTVTATFYKSVGSDSVQVKLLRNHVSGELSFAIADWPGGKRSEESQAMEAALLRKLGAPLATMTP